MNNRLVIPSDWKLPREITSRFGEQAGRQRLMQSGGHLLLVLHEVPDPDSVERRGVLFWRDPEGNWEGNARGNGIEALKKHVKTYAEYAEDLNQELDTTRDAKGLFEILSKIAPFLRAAKNMHLVLQAARDAVGNDMEIITLRDSAEAIERTTELVRTEAKNALDFDIARRAEEQSEQNEEITVAAHRLNLLAAIFFPITAVSSVLGVNMRTGLETWLTPLRFWILIGMSLLLGLPLRFLLAKSRAKRKST